MCGEQWTTCGEKWAGDGPFLPMHWHYKNENFDCFKTCNCASVKSLKLKRVMNKLKLKELTFCNEQSGES